MIDMSSLITLRLPFLDIDCLKNAISSCGLNCSNLNQNVQLSNGIIFEATNIGYIARVNYAQKQIVDKIYHEYEVQYKEKMKQLQDSQNTLNYLMKQEEQKLAELQQLRKQMQSTNPQKISKSQQELEQIQKEKAIKEIEAQKEIERNKELEKVKEIYLNNIVEKIEEKAKQKGYQIRKIQQQGKTQLVLVRNS